MSVMMVLAVSCTSNKPEDKVAEAIDNEVKGEKVEAKMNKDLEKIFGKEDSKFKKSVGEYILKTTKFSYSEIKVTGTSATAKVRVTVPRQDELAGILMMAAFLDKKKLKETTLNEFVVELAKSARKTASLSDLQTESYEAVITLNQANDVWTVDKKSIDSFMTKKNKVK